LILIADIVETPRNVAAISDDPNDDSIVAAAVVARAEALVTLDRHLHQAKVKDYCRLRGIVVLTDVELLARLRA
jgi:predicted nucleic acid-binding protein